MLFIDTFIVGYVFHDLQSRIQINECILFFLFDPGLYLFGPLMTSKEIVHYNTKCLISKVSPDTNYEATFVGVHRIFRTKLSCNSILNSAVSNQFLQLITFYDSKVIYR